jgi:hypothetical protein
MQNKRYADIGPGGRKLTGRYTHDKNQEEPDTEMLAHGSYGGLLFDPRWKAKRLEIMARDKGQCVICQSAEELQVHHRQYQFIKAENAFKVPWDYPGHLLITLCRNCHQRGHSKFKVPTITL